METRLQRLQRIHRERIAARTPAPAWVWINPDATEADLIALIAFEDLDAPRQPAMPSHAYKEKGSP